MTGTIIPFAIKQPIMVVAFFFYLLTAKYSTGYYHPDEHYQIIEFANLKRGLTTAGELPWEYNARIRSAFQPAICYVVFNTLNAAGIYDRHYLTMALRMLSAILAFTVISMFVYATRTSVQKENRNAYLLLSFFLWFIPFLNVRFSSENWSGLFFLGALSILQWPGRSSKGHFLMAGLLMGASFLCRFQAGILCAGILGWLLLIRKERRTNVLVLLLAMATMVQLGVLIDYWYYGTYTYTSWNYLYATCLSGEPPRFGTEPWYFFFAHALDGWLMPFGISAMPAIVILLIRRPLHPVLWSILPFIVIHCAIVHKEDRFLFPVVNMFPVILIHGYEELRIIIAKRFPAALVPAIGKLAVAGGLVIFNTLALLTFSFRAPGNGNKNLLQYIDRKFGNRPIRLLYCNYNPLYFSMERFYQDKRIRERRLASVSDLENEAPDPNAVDLLVIWKSTLDDPLCSRFLDRLRYKPEACSVAPWVEWLSDLYGSTANKEILLLYRRQ